MTCPTSLERRAEPDRLNSEVRSAKTELGTSDFCPCGSEKLLLTQALKVVELPAALTTTLPYRADISNVIPQYNSRVNRRQRGRVHFNAPLG